MAAWFSKRRDEDEAAPDEHGADDEWAAESTIEVKAQVIADAVRAAEAEPEQAGSPALASGIAADGVVGDGDFTDEAVDKADEDLALDLDRALAERKSLVQLCLYALDRARSAGVAERLEEGLAGIGVDALRPDGDRFDPAHHEAGGTVATEDESLDGLVAETEVVGFSDRGELLRAPIVTVYSKGAAS
jgi:molecular chaperone GrpE